MELLVFPKTFARTKDLWVERNPICIVGKTPREEGDNKIFVENAYALTPSTAADVARQLTIGQSGGQSRANNAPSEPEKYLRLTLTAEDLKQHTEELKKIFSQYPGNYAVYLQVGASVIKAGVQIAWNDAVSAALSVLFGEGCVTVDD